MPGIDISRAAAIWYNALATRFTAGETFVDALTDTVAAAAAIDPDAVAAVNAAGDAVGVPLPPTFSTFNASAPFGQSRRQDRTSTYTLPADVAARITLIGNHGDDDLYVKQNAPASTSSFDRKSTGATSNESCTITGKGAGTNNVYVYADAAFTNDRTRDTRSWRFFVRARRRLTGVVAAPASAPRCSRRTTTGCLRGRGPSP